MSVGRESVDLGIVSMKRSVLAREFEQEGLKLADRAAFNVPGDFRGKLRDL